VFPINTVEDLFFHRQKYFFHSWVRRYT